MFFKLAIRNVRRQIGNYLIYFMTVLLTVALLFAVNNIIFCRELASYSSALPELKTGLVGLVIFISLVVAFVLGYATSFMLKLRKREFGMYLTMGMTRRNILTLFVSETMLICLLALAAGIGLGLLIYQGLMAVTLYLLEADFSLSGYSLSGLLFTVGLVVGIFLLSSFTSALYLRRVTIYELIHGGKKAERAVKFPRLWLVVTVVSFGLMIVSFVSFWREMEHSLENFTDAYGIFPPIFLFAAAVILFHTGFSRSVVCLLLRRKSICCRGTNVFVLRQLSSALGSNSVMIGFLAFLLTFAVIGANVSFETKSTQENYLRRAYPYDIVYYDGWANAYHREGADMQGRPSPEEAEQIIGEYVPIQKKISYTMYDSGRDDLYRYTSWYGEGYEMLTDHFMTESDFNALMTPLGYEPVELEEEFIIVANVAGMGGDGWTNASFTQDGVTYHFKDILTDYPEITYVYFYAVVSDEAVKNMDPAENGVAYDLAEEPYDLDALENALSYTVTENLMGEKVSLEENDFIFRERGRQEMNGQNVMLVIGALFAAGVFLLMALAILALKTLSGLEGARRDYGLLFRLGAGEREQARALFRQTFCFFLTPFVMPFFMGLPVAWIFIKIFRLSGMETAGTRFYRIAAAIALVMAVIYLLYYMAAYLVARRTVVCREA